MTALTINFQKNNAVKKLISISIIFLFYQSAQSQENPARKDFLFENPATKEQIKIEIGSKVAIRFKMPNVKITGTILSLSDSSLILGIRQQPYRQFIPFRNIAKMVVIEANRRLIFRVTLKSGEMMQGKVIRITQDSLTMTTLNAQHILIGGSDIKSIRIHSKGAIGRRLGVCAGTGAVIGAIVGQNAHKSLNCSGSSLCNATDQVDEFGATVLGALIGAVAGTAAGALSLAVLPSDKEFKIEGSQAQFDLFATEFMK